MAKGKASGGSDKRARTVRLMHVLSKTSNLCIEKMHTSSLSTKCFARETPKPFHLQISFFLNPLIYTVDKNFCQVPQTIVLANLVLSIMI